MLDHMKLLLKKVLLDSKKLSLAIVLSAFLIRLVYIFSLDDRWYFYDTVHYDKAARSIVAGEGFGKGYRFSENVEFQQEYSLPPVYPVFLAGIYYIFGPHLFVVRVIQSIIGSFLCLMIFYIAREIFNEKVAIVASLISISYPMFIFISGLLYVEVIFTLLIALTIWSLLKYFNHRKLGYLLLGGLFLGLATLARPIFFAFYPFLGLWFIVSLDQSLRSKINAAVVVYFMAVLTLLPWTVRNYTIFGKITPVSASFGWYLSNVEKRVERASTSRNLETNHSHHLNVPANRLNNPTQVANDEFLGRVMSKVYHLVMDDPEGFFKHYFKEFVHFWTLYPDRVETENELTNWLAKLVGILTFGPVLVFFLIGAYYSISHWQKASLIFLTVISFALGYSFFLTRVRYRIPIEPYMIILAVYGILHLYGRLKDFAPNENIIKRV